ncbi:MAG: M36 family metallopeptidase [Solirubrobacterales bacterium]|nr:M36 family metallopeptidase [Solirubrobacterales bacterium]
MLRRHAVAVVLLLLALPPVARAAEPGASDVLVRSRAVAPVPAAVAGARRDARRAMGRLGLLQTSPRTGTVRAYGRLDRTLTGESARDARDIALDYVRGHRDVFGLDAGDLAALEPDGRLRAGGIEQVRWRQSYRGIPAIDTELVANLTATGRLVNVLGAPRRDLRVPSTDPAVDAGAAYAAAAAALGGVARAPRSGPEGATQATTFAGGGRAALVLYEADAGPRLGWRLLVPAGEDHVYDAVVDATSGALVRQQDLVERATGLAYRNAPGAAVGGTAETMDLTPYLDAGATTLNGPTAHTFTDSGDVVAGPSSAIPSAGEVAPSGGNWNFTLTPVGTCTPVCVWDPATANSWQVNRAADATQLHWLVSNFHDHLAGTDIGFTTSAGNFEGTDRVLAQSMDGAAIAGGRPDVDHVDNANMATYPEPYSPHMQMYLTSSGRSTAFDASVVYHEYTHGLVGRTIVDAQGYQAVGGPQGGALNEGTADWYAADYLYGEGLETDGAGIDVTLARYAFGSLRTQPTDCPVGSASGLCDAGNAAGPGGYTLGDFGKVWSGGPEVHADGEIWTQALWQLRARLIADHGAADGVSRARRLVTNGMRLAPDNPTFLDLRNAILQADAAGGFGDEAAIWDVFAARGMGYFASVTDAGDTAPVEDFQLPPSGAGSTGTVAGTVTDAATGVGQSGVTVAFTGHDTGVGPELSATTAADGTYAIAAVPAGTYPLLRASGGALEAGSASGVAVAAGVTTTRSFALRRNLAASAGGATIAGFNGPNYSGCGPGALIDGSQGIVWGSDAPSFDGVTKYVIVQLPVATAVAGFEIDPGAGCGDDDSASLAGYEVQVSTDGSLYTKVAQGTFTAADNHRLNVVTPTTQVAGTRFVKLVAKGSQSALGSGADYLDVAELRAFAAAGGPQAPTATTSPASAMTPAGATLNGLVDPNGTATDYRFEYGTTTSYGSVAPASPASAGAGDDPVVVAEPVTGLAPATTYHFRLVALRGGVRYAGTDRTFTTAPAATVAPVAVTGAASAIRSDSATIAGTVDPKGTATSFQVEYGTSDAYGAVAPAAPRAVGSGTGPVAVGETLVALAPNTTYHYRVVAIRGGLRTPGADATFTTAAVTDPAPPAASTDPIGTDAGTTTAVLAGTVNPRGKAASYHFEYGLTTAYGLRTADLPAGSGTVATPVSVVVSGLAPGTTYHYRLVATTEDGTTAGQDRTFTTRALTTSTPGGTTPDPGTPPPAATTTSSTRLTGRAGPRSARVSVSCTVATATRRATCTVTARRAARRRASVTIRRGRTVVAKGRTRRASAKGAVRVTGTALRARTAYRLTLAVRGRKTVTYTLRLAGK